MVMLHMVMRSSMDMLSTTSPAYSRTRLSSCETMTTVRPRSRLSPASSPTSFSFKRSSVCTVNSKASPTASAVWRARSSGLL